MGPGISVKLSSYGFSNPYLFRISRAASLFINSRNFRAACLSLARCSITAAWRMGG